MIKKLVLFLFICVLLQLCLAQTSYYKAIPIQVPPWLYHTSFTAKAVFPCSDNSVIIVGEVSDLMEGMWPINDVCIIKLDANGNCIWQRFTNLWLSLRLNVVGINIDENDNVYYFVQFTGLLYHVPLWIYKTDSNGNTIQISNNESYSFTEVSRAIRLPNNEIIAVGRGRGPSPYSNNYSDYYAFMRVSATGDSLSYKQYPPALNAENSFVKAYDVDLDIDGLPVATCYINQGTLSVVKFDLTGNIINRNDWYCNPYPPEGLLITKMPSDSTLVCGYYNNNSGYSLIKLENGSLDAMFTIPGQKKYGALLAGDNQLYIAGYDRDVMHSTVNSYDFEGLQNWGWGNVGFPWASFYNPSPERLAIAQDNTIFCVAGESTHLIIVKLLPNGQITENYDEMVYPVHNDLIVYPNPMKHTLNIEVSSNDKPNKASEKVTIYNVKGQSVRTINLQNKADNKYSAVWDGKDSKGLDCSTGVYYCKTSLDGRNLIKKIILTK